MKKLSERASWPALLTAGAGVLLGMWALESRLTESAELAADNRAAPIVALNDLDQEMAERHALSDLVARDLSGAKKNAARLSRSQRDLFEGSLALSEEKRLLEKQWEIMTTFLLLDPAGDRVQVMRGEQAYETWPLSGAKPRAVRMQGRTTPKMSTIVSKERYAHPERGKSEEVGGRLDWTPPEVGTSARARALGENVLFTREGLVLHGPPLDKAEHEAYPHLCLSLSADTARHLYGRSFVGTRVMLKDKGSP